MFAYSSIWAAEDWATQGGRIKTDWSKAPFVANYYDINLDICGCYSSGGCSTSCSPAAAPYTGACQLSQPELGQMQWVQGTNKIYDYCVDPKQWDNGQWPVECSLPQY
jgi:xyloglucan:xyloglucosyl transferase